MTPGPTRVPERVLRAGARPMIHHRTPEFSRELATAIELLAPVFGTRSTPLPVHTTGRGALEAAICNLFSPGDEIAMCCNGKFGEMWAGFAESYGLVVHRFSTSWERRRRPDELDALLDAHPRYARRHRRVRRHVDRRRERRRRRSRASRARTARSRSSTASRRSAECPSRSTNGASTSPSPRRRNA